MSSSFFLGEDMVVVSNVRLSALIDFALTVGSDIASNSSEDAYVQKFRAASDAFFPGVDVDLGELSSCTAEAKFWCAAFAEVAARIERGQLGNAETHGWRSGAAADAMRVSRILLHQQLR